MLSLFKRYFGVLIFAGGSSAVLAFSLLGPFKAWQVDGLGYDLTGDIGGPMTLAEGYRWNVPDVVYAFDQSFIAYFGTEGMAAVEKAIRIINDLPPASKITHDGSRLFVNGQRVPFDTKRVNYQAQADGLLDLKSYALVLILEELGLAEPERYVWTLRGRDQRTIGGVTFTNYSVIKLNYDPITLQPSSFVNGVEYTYRIQDPYSYNDRSEAVETAVDPLAFSFSAVAGGAPFWGEFYTGLTHDDVGALRFLFNPSNFAVESAPPGTSPGSSRFRGSPWVPFNTLSNIFSNTNINVTPGLTNVAGLTNLTNFVVTAVRPGIDKLTFRRGNYDSLIGQTFLILTNQWSDKYLSNGLPRTQPLQRRVTQPDVLFGVGDLGVLQNLTPVLIRRTTTTAWVNNDALNGIGGQGGPGVITSPVLIEFTDQLPFFENQAPQNGEDDAFFGSGVWASFDGTTNAPVIYPRYLDLTLDDLRQLSGSQ